ncbi:hypothetical protein [Streptomyces flavofungini]|uniref:Integral membrane protein n=1 Tax=Streptomyces flavofungini TaxID=68200 RepID=A0ABS0X3N0_9ACTN|nr:hypothetical protein [Streptomyces flavofungini]MBJ3807649.1 hypothetical protein [Streptomyces flavofungini]GHC64200.1 hypothetical protein GCM10010349_35200 [Streptomyces flavofungini]
MSQWPGTRVDGQRERYRSPLWPKRAARRLFDPTWIPDPVDPLVEDLKRFRVSAGLVAAVGVYTFVAQDFAFEEVLENLAIACLVLLLVTPLTVGAMLFVWRRDGPLRVLRTQLFGSLKLLLGFVAAVLGTLLLLSMGSNAGAPVLAIAPAVFWMMAFVVRAAVRINSNFFGTAAVHRCLPPLLASVTSWLMALPDLITGDLHGLSLTLGVLFILGAPVAVTGIALLEMSRLRRFHGIRLRRHPAHASRLP